MEEGRGVYRVLVGKTEGKRPLRRSRRRWLENIKTYLQEVGRGVWIGLSWLRIESGSRTLVNVVTSYRVFTHAPGHISLPPQAIITAVN
jgi:hypothetical protein